MDGTPLGRPKWARGSAAAANRGVGVGAKSSEGRTALHRAAKGGHDAVVRLLVEKGANAEAEGKGGMRALHSASRSGREPMVRLLIEKGANAKARNCGGGTALH